MASGSKYAYAVSISIAREDGGVKRSRIARLYHALWVLLVAALFAAFALWGMQLGSMFGSARLVRSPEAVVATAPQVVTVYSAIGPPNPATLCAEISPTPARVMVESTTGVVLETLRCTP